MPRITVARLGIRGDNMGIKYKTLSEAIGQALHSLNAGGVPVILRREATPREALKEIRIRWEYGPATGGADRLAPRPYGDSNRGRCIVETRWFESGVFTRWLESSDQACLFTLDDLYSKGFHEPVPWEVFHPHHAGQSGYPCHACIADENRAKRTRFHSSDCVAGKMEEHRSGK